jgi:hypothetical protein
MSLKENNYLSPPKIINLSFERQAACPSLKKKIKN